MFISLKLTAKIDKGVSNVISVLLRCYFFETSVSSNGVLFTVRKNVLETVPSIFPPTEFSVKDKCVGCSGI